MKVYIAGPMRGYPNNNFAAFDAAKAYLHSSGYTVISPADKDRAAGFDGTEEATDENFDMVRAVRADIEGIIEADAIYMLKGWEKSTGARAEHAVALWLGKTFLYE